MSLKQFHVVFITLSIVCALLFACWAGERYFELKTFGYLIAACVSLFIAAGMVAYEIYFLKKTKSFA